MSIEVYTPGFANRHEITHAISLETAVYYNEIGKITLVLPIDDYNIQTVKKGSLVFDTKAGDTWWVNQLKIDTVNNRITANGYTSNWILNSRVLYPRASLTRVERDVLATVSACLRGLSYVEVAADSGLPAACDVELFGGQLLDEIIKVLDGAEYGHRMRWSDTEKKFTFEVYNGIDRTSGNNAVRFSEEWGSAEDLVINEDDSIFKNFAYVHANDASGKETAYAAGEATGDERREVWIDGTTITYDKDEETAAEYETRLRNFGLLELGKYAEKQGFNVAVDASELGTKYNLGDVVSCVSKRFGVVFNSRVTGKKFKSDINGQSTQLILGDPILYR